MGFPSADFIMFTSTVMLQNFAPVLCTQGHNDLFLNDVIRDTYQMNLYVIYKLTFERFKLSGISLERF